MQFFCTGEERQTDIGPMLYIFHYENAQHNNDKGIQAFCTTSAGLSTIILLIQQEIF